MQTNPDVLDEILNLIESVSEDFPSFSYSNTFPFCLYLGFGNIQCLKLYRKK